MILVSIPLISKRSRTDRSVVKSVRIFWLVTVEGDDEGADEVKEASIFGDTKVINFTTD
jgi:hypothetical protein